MTDRELMQMAFDAIEPWKHGMSTGSDMYKAMEALRARLAQPEPEPEKSLSQRMREAGFTPRDTRLECDGCGKKFSRLMLPIHNCEVVQPEPEPVAWGIANTRPTEKNPLMMVMLDEPEPSHLVVPLYTAPPRKEWQGLTDEEYVQIMQEADRDAAKTGSVFQNLRHAIEAKLKEKNGGG